MSHSSILFSVLSIVLFAAVAAAEPNEGRVLFEEDFENGLDRWQVLDPETWKLFENDGNTTFGITARKSKYEPPHRSPYHVALIKNLKLSEFEITFRVRSTKDTGNHRDCCVFFCYQDSRHFYYAHLGAKPDPHSGQIMIVDDAPRKAITQNERTVAWDDDWHRVKLVRHAHGQIDVYFDDMEKPHLSAVDKTFGAGSVGIGSFDDLNEFDDLVVRSLPVSPAESK